ncbi:hypothetical protein DFQ13_11934 [Actinokineospora spheciospongiae]|nr:hypothetical protein DFQ13_11934 [Actinokineospora spheciospongiae]
MAHCLTVRPLLWTPTYRRVVRTAFATVPHYRELWALHGRTDPTLVPGRTGAHAGATPAEVAVERLPDLVPLRGGPAEANPYRGLETAPLGHPVPLAAARDHPGAGIIRDDLLGVLAVRADCGRWHLCHRDVYARATPLGLAFTLLRQRSPMLVDIAPGTQGAVGACPIHGKPVVEL